MLADKAELSKTIRSIQAFDANASPYVAVSLPPDSSPLFYCSSAFGFVQSKDFGGASQTNVSISHLKECLAVLRDEKVELSLDPSGILKISSTDNTFESELRVHTVNHAQAGLKLHTVGDIATRLPFNTFLGLNTTPFKPKTPPVLACGRIMLATSDAVIMWDGPDSLKGVASSPREAFLRTAAGNPAVTDIVLTANNYWGVVTNDLVTFSYGHTLGRELFNIYNVPATELVHLPAERLVYSLRAAAGLIGDKDRVDVDPKVGVISRNKFGSEAKFSLGGTAGWTKFGVFGGTAQAIVDALSQSKDDEAILSRVSMTHPTLRLRRGPMEVSFKTI
jgi:hypothetical protein